MSCFRQIVAQCSRNSALLGRFFLDSTALDLTALDSTALDSTALDSTALDSTALDLTALDSTALDSTALDSTALDSTALDSTAAFRRIWRDWRGLLVGPLGGSSAAAGANGVIRAYSQQADADGDKLSKASRSGNRGTRSCRLSCGFWVVGCGLGVATRRGEDAMISRAATEPWQANFGAILSPNPYERSCDWNRGWYDLPGAVTGSPDTGVTTSGSSARGSGLLFPMHSKCRMINVVMYGQSLRSLPPLESRRNRTHNQPLVSCLHFTDGFRSHGNLTPPRGRRVSPSKMLFRECVKFALFNMEKKGSGVEDESFVGPRRPAKPDGRLGAPLPRELS